MSTHSKKNKSHQRLEQERLEALAALKILDTAPEENYDRLVHLAVDFFQIPICFISFLDETRQWFKSQHGLQQKQLPRHLTFCNETIKRTEPLIINDTHLNEQFANNPYVRQDPYIRFYAGVPLTNPQGYNVGTFCLADTSPKELDAKQLNLLLNLANIAIDEISLRNANFLLRKIRKQLELRNRFIHKIFSFYMSDEVVKTILESPERQKLGGQENKITIMFSDLRNFTPLSEALSGEKLISLLNGYFTKMVRVIEKYQGTVDAFIGDAIMVIFGAPHSLGNDSLRAITCALEMQKELKKLNRANQKLNLPHLEMGIGINTGLAVVGNIGSKKRMQYSAIGSAVNLSSRIQGLSLGGQTLISESTYQEVAKDIEISGHLRVKVKGIDSPITIYDVARLNPFKAA
ncbi:MULTISPECIES: adenylate/guanylate cyclase domain-containing protein [Legionella]|uniref:Fused adenylate cyclase/two component hybrid sensor/regulator n=1 Tax=Legionella drozanskii LLAP-1 TaxID=1212489 RepID=A0A0W0SQF5_9GAMM|nr:MULTISPECIES: adenylate/guanylate cyclase domain-containing protein [Legionella]KTC85615.1 fused adenylate cyclase/two component hybrid sensor/regulator [Legionella drozanskii LLAP-1]PJE16156.1 MAG: adenylate cyclase [Legionella sp.]